ncbi:MAG: MmgE/PrpD family protein [Actinomycetota bacterium]
MTELTDHLWDRYGRLTLDDLPADVVTVVHHCILDWFGCTLAGSSEPLAAILRDELAADAGPCSIIGTRRRADALRAALINGAAGHALDFDDTSPVMGAHATVPLLPAVLALAQEQGRSGADLVTAYAVGMEVQARIGASIGREHYAKGWHTTSTIGVFGAAAASSRLLDLDNERFGAAMGIAASNASGLKANFGTMTKPLHAGQAAERGMLAARLAARGYTANAEAVDGNQGLAQAAGAGALDRSGLDDWADRWATPSTLFKYHAACHLTHAGIEATSSILADGVDPAAVERVTLTVHPAILDVCGIPEPTTGLEAKFSLRGTQALLLNGIDTAAVTTFGDEPINRPDVQATVPKVLVETDPSMAAMATMVEVATADGVRRRHHDVSRPSDDLADQGARLRRKFEALAGPVVGGDEAAVMADRLGEVSTIGTVDELVARS